MQTLWRDDLSLRDAFQPHKQLLDQQLFERNRVVVRDTTGEQAFKRIGGTLHAFERSLILAGDLPSLRTHPNGGSLISSGIMILSSR